MVETNVNVFIFFLPSSRVRGDNDSLSHCEIMLKRSREILMRFRAENFFRFPFYFLYIIHCEVLGFSCLICSHIED